MWAKDTPQLAREPVGGSAQPNTKKPYGPRTPPNWHGNQLVALRNPTQRNHTGQDHPPTGTGTSWWLCATHDTTEYFGKPCFGKPCLGKRCFGKPCIGNHVLRYHALENHVLENHALANHALGNHALENNVLANHVLENHVLVSDSLVSRSLLLSSELFVVFLCY